MKRLFVCLLAALTATVPYATAPVRAGGQGAGKSPGTVRRARKAAQGEHFWEGTYTFTESEGRTAGRSGSLVEHTIKVYRRGDTLMADIDAAGFQTSRSLSCDAKVDGNNIRFFFRSYREDNLSEQYRVGQLLLSFERRAGGAGILTRWGAYRPVFKAARAGTRYFRKIG